MKHWNIFLLISGILLTLAGIWAFINPAQTVYALAWIIGIVALATGIFYLLAYFFGKNKAWHKGWTLSRGILDVIIGVVLLWNIEVTAAVLPWVFGFWALFSGILYISQAFSSRAAGARKWGWLLMAGIIAIVIGLAMIAVPLFGVFVITFQIGFFLLFFGIASIMASITMDTELDTDIGSPDII